MDLPETGEHCFNWLQPPAVLRANLSRFALGKLITFTILDAEMNSRETVGYYDCDGFLHQWYVEECHSWPLVFDGTLFARRGEYVLRSLTAACTGALAERIEPEIAAELLLGSGFALPSDLVRLTVISQKIDKPKMPSRSKPRRPRRQPKGQYGLVGFAKSKRKRDSR